MYLINYIAYIIILITSIIYFQQHGILNKQLFLDIKNSNKERCGVKLTCFKGKYYLHDGKMYRCYILHILLISISLLLISFGITEILFIKSNIFIAHDIIDAILAIITFWLLVDFMGQGKYHQLKLQEPTFDELKAMTEEQLIGAFKDNPRFNKQDDFIMFILEIHKDWEDFRYFLNSLRSEK